MIEPKIIKNTDRFLVDIGHGYHFHNKGCVAAVNPSGAYTELSYGEIKKLRNYNGVPFEPDICVKVWQNAPQYWGQYSDRNPMVPASIPALGRFEGTVRTDPKSIRGEADES
jgi:hypothetical protein